MPEISLILEAGQMQIDSQDIRDYKWLIRRVRVTLTCIGVLL